MNHFLVLFVYHCIIGKVCGVPIEMSEDMVRRDYIDKAAKDIKPTVRPKLYSVEFVPIEHNGVLKGMRYCCRCLNIVMLIPCKFIFPWNGKQAVSPSGHNLHVSYFLYLAIFLVISDGLLKSEDIEEFV